MFSAEVISGVDELCWGLTDVVCEDWKKARQPQPSPVLRRLPAIPRLSITATASAAGWTITFCGWLKNATRCWEREFTRTATALSPTSKTRFVKSSHSVVGERSCVTDAVHFVTCFNLRLVCCGRKLTRKASPYSITSSIYYNTQHPPWNMWWKNVSVRLSTDCVWKQQW